MTTIIIFSLYVIEGREAPSVFLVFYFAQKSEIKSPVREHWAFVLGIKKGATLTSGASMSVINHLIQ